MMLGKNSKMGATAAHPYTPIGGGVS
jgi:hypothetical protein